MSRKASPGFSIIVPTHNRHSQLDRCLASLAALDFPANEYEVIVVDDGGLPGAAAVVESYSQVIRARLIRIRHSGPAAARNAGVEQSSGARLAFIDDDCSADPRWLSMLADGLEKNAGAAVGGRVRNALDLNRYARASQKLQDFLYRWYHDENRGDLRFFTTNNLAVSRRDFDAIGPFDSSFTFASEDRDWCDRALHAGIPLVYEPAAVVHHSHDLTLRTFLRQHYRYGQGAVRFHTMRAKRRGERVRLEPAEFYRGMFRAPFVDREPAPLSDSLLILASQSASLLGFASDLVRAGAARNKGG